MNKTMYQIADATLQALNALNNGQASSFRTQRFGNNKYSVSMSTIGVPATDHIVVVSYRGTAVAQFYSNSTVKLQTGGYHTVTTKAVINAALWGARAPFSVYQQDFSWYVHLDGTELNTKNGGLPFKDGMRLELRSAAQVAA